jgi:REP element-mobilizing transposase RayT
MDIFYDPDAEKQIHSRNLPHWMQHGRMYFVTFRLSDSLPHERIEQIRAERRVWEQCNHQPYSQWQWLEYHRLFSKRIEDWLDNNIGTCVLAHQQCASIVANAIGHFEGKRYRLDHWIIMPNHVHMLIVPIEPYLLFDILHSIKSYTAKIINKCLGRKGQLWQHESFDHIVRSNQQLEKFREYILENAAKCPQKSVLSKQKVA